MTLKQQHQLLQVHFIQSGHVVLRLAMELGYCINLLFLFVLNVLFFFSGVFLNSLVIISFYRSAQLRKKLCFFTIMLLSCFDLVAVLANNPAMALLALLCLAGSTDVHLSRLYICSGVSNMFQAFSILALLVMSFERYLAAYYPIFHRTSLSRKKLSAILAVLILCELIFGLLSLNDMIISKGRYVLAFFVIVGTALIFINFKLFIIARKYGQTQEPRKMRKFTAKNISSCLLAVALIVVLSIPAFVFVGLKSSPKGGRMKIDAELAALWTKCIASMNCTFNCLIFYWKNKILRTEGGKVLRSIKKRQRIGK